MDEPRPMVSTFVRLAFGLLAIATPLHDAKGNLVRNERGYGFTYDFENRLTRVFTDSDLDGQYDPGEPVHAEYLVDPLGRRVRTWVGPASAPFVTYRYYDGPVVLAEFDAGDPAAPAACYFNGPNYLDEKLLIKGGAGTGGSAEFYVLLKDLYTVAGVTDADGQFFEWYTYTGYGLPTVHAAAGGSACPPCDANCDGQVNAFDIDAFVAVLTGGERCSPCAGDANCDGQVSALDIDPFLACLANGPGPGCRVAPCQPCDANCDGTVNSFDVDPFVDVLIGGSACSWCAGDANCDGTVNTFDVDPFVACLTSGGGASCLWNGGGAPPAANPFYFTGQRVDELDPDPNGVPRLVLYDYKARVYDPRHGRFQQRDPGEFADTYNLYEYAASRVTVLSDPTGEFSLPEISLSSLISRGLQAFNAASTARDVLLKARALAAGASFQSVLLAFVVEQALDRVGGDAFERALKLVQSVGQATRRAVFSTTAGKLAETAAGIKGPKIAIEVGGNIRIPDSLSRELLQEVKFTTSGKLGITDQLRDFIDFAKSTGRKMELIVPEGTEVVGELRDAWLRGDLEIKFELP